MASSSHGGHSSKQSSSSASNSDASSAYPPSATEVSYRKVLRQSAAAMMFVQGFDSAQASALETTTHLLSTYLNAICQSIKMNVEASNRTIACPADVWLALINAGFDVQELPEYIEKIAQGGTLVIPAPKHLSSNTSNQPLRVGRTRPHPQYVNEFLPPFPDPHTYIRTEISGEPESSYEKVRELASQRKRDTEQSLVDFMLRVHPRTCLLRDFENKIKEEARKGIIDRERRKEDLKRAKKQAELAASVQNNRIQSAEEMMEEDFLETSGSEDKPQENGLNGEEEEEIEFDLEETETSLLLRHIPSHFLVLDPSLETRPYLSALVSEELQDDDDSDKKTTRKQQQNSNKDGEEQAYDNPFLRPARMPSKGTFPRF